MATVTVTIILWLLLVGFRPSVCQGSDDPCTNVDLQKKVPDPCEPCKEGDWLELILYQRANIKKTSKCFNSFPLGTNTPVPVPEPLTKGDSSIPDLNLEKTPRSFEVTRLPFLRYNTRPAGTQQSGPAECANHVCPYFCAGGGGPAGKPEDNLDFSDVGRYFTTNASSQTDIQLIEWPGKTDKDYKKALEKELQRQCTDLLVDKPSHCYKYKFPRNFRRLKFHKESSKLLHYPCNKQEGSQISALGLMSIPNRDEEKEREEPENTIYLAFDKDRIFHKHAKPIHVSEHILNEMAKPDGEGPPGICRTVEPHCYYNDQSPFCAARQKYFEERGEIIFNDAVCSGASDNNTNCNGCKMNMLISDDLRTVLDFTFIQGKLILAMRCGILVVDDILVRRLDIYPSELITFQGKHKHSFKPVTKIASNHCCKSDDCRQTIIAAYPAAPKVNLNRELYISYDLGRTFAVKLIAEPHSALNLMLGMFKMYQPWLLYHQLLEQPDPEDLKDDAGEEVHKGYEDIRSKPDWDSLTTEEKELKFLYGDGRNDFVDFEDAVNDTLRYVRLRIPGSLGRFTRKRREGHPVDLDMSHEWLQKEIGTFRAKFGWHKKWTDSNCDSVPQCREKFEDDAAVTYFLGQSETVVKTPKRATDVPFCDQIVSLAVLEEQDALYVLCLVGFGDFSIPDDPLENPPCSSRQHELKYGPTAVTEPPTSTEPYVTDTTTTATTTFDNSSTTTETPSVVPPGASPGFNPANASCNYKNPKGGRTTFPYNPCVNPVKYYAVYTIFLNEKLPLALLDERRSERLFTCANMEVPLDWSGCKSLFVEPDMIRIPNSISLLIQNCKDVLYYSPNGGRTMFNTEFYAHHSEGIGQSGQAGSAGCHANETELPPNPPEHQRQLMYRLNSLNVPPQINISPLGNVVLMTMRNTYAYGLLGGNKGFKMVVGKVFPFADDNVLLRVKTNTYAFPSFTVSGQPFFAVALKLIYSHNPIYACQLYHERSGMRLVHMDPFLYKDAAFYYNENQDLLQSVREMGLGVDVCHTRSFKVKPRVLRLDVGESGNVEVSASDLRPNIPLSILSSEEKSNTVEVSILDRDSKAEEGALHVTHDWDVNIHAIRNYKKRVQALIHSFFGIENSNMYGFSTQVSLANDLGLRCHNQPTATIRVHTECRNKKIIAHEDEHRPQCSEGTFSQRLFTYTLKKGTFDPNMVAFFIEMDKKEGKSLIKLDKDTGDLEIIYDYIRFGCPLEPYKDEPFIPDLRIASLETKYNTSLGVKYDGPFLIIELFGTRGFYFSEKFKDQKCQFKPINISHYIDEWIHRKRMFRIAHGRQTRPSLNVQNIVDKIKNATTIEEMRSFEKGNKLFYPDAVDHPINIINRVTYRDCRKWRSFFLESENISQHFKDLTDSEQEEYGELEFPIMNRDGENTINWKRNSQPIYIFMAVALDPSESICEYYTIFGVSIPAVAETKVYVTLGIFLVLVVLWIAIFLCGYTWRKASIRDMCIDLERKRRLEEAAWKVVYRYEKLLQEHENHNLEAEFEEFKEIETEKLRIRTEQKELIKH